MSRKEKFVAHIVLERLPAKTHYNGVFYYWIEMTVHATDPQISELCQMQRSLRPDPGSNYNSLPSCNSRMNKTTTLPQASQQSMNFEISKLVYC